MFILLGILGFFAGYLQKCNQDPIEKIENILGNNLFMVLNEFNIAIESGVYSYIEINSSSQFRFIFCINKENEIIEVPVTLSDLKKMNPCPEFIHIFSYIDDIILKNPHLNF